MVNYQQYKPFLNLIKYPSSYFRNQDCLVIDGKVEIGEKLDNNQHVICKYGGVPMYEIDINSTITETSKFSVDYQEGVVYFDQSLENQFINISWYATHKIRYKASSVMIDDVGSLYEGDNVEDAFQETAKNINNVKCNVNNIVAYNGNGLKDPELIQARTDVQGTIHQTLKESMDTNYISIQNNSLMYANDTGVANNYQIILTPTINSYSVGQVVYFKAKNTNTGASTLTVSPLGTISIKKNVSYDLEAGDILAGQIIACRYDGSNFQIADTLNQIGNIKSQLAESAQKFADIEANKADKTEVNTLATDKADKTYVDTQIASVASGSPKGVYATLADLQAAYPTGNTDIYLVLADGNWYYWNSSAWTAGGVYQSTGVADNAISTPKLKNNSVTLGKLNKSVSPLFTAKTNDNYLCSPTNYLDFVTLTIDGVCGVAHRLKNEGKPIKSINLRAKLRNDSSGKLTCYLIDKADAVLTNLTSLENIYKYKCEITLNASNISVSGITTNYIFTFDGVVLDSDYYYVAFYAKGDAANIYMGMRKTADAVPNPDVWAVTTTYPTYSFNYVSQKWQVDTADRIAPTAVTVESASLNIPNEVTPWNGKICATLGSSLTANGGWTDVLKSRFGFSKMYNRGTGGTTLANFSGYGLGDYVGGNNIYTDTQNYTEDRASVFCDDTGSATRPYSYQVGAWYSHFTRINLLPTDSDLVIVDLATNDFYRSYNQAYITQDAFLADTTIKTVYGESVGAYAYNDTLFCDAFMLMIKRIMARCPKAKIVVWGMLYNSTISTPDSMAYYLRMIDKIKEMCRKTGTYFIDTFSEMGVNVFNSSQYIEDGVHPYTSSYATEKGKYAVANVLTNHLKNIYPKDYGVA